MSAGTISIQNNAAAVAGDGTAFTTELSAGDFIIITTGGVTYTLPVKSIESDTALTMARNYNGPAVTDAAWTAMPRDTLNRISAQTAADTAYIIRQRVLEVDNWYQLLEVNGIVTIKMADGSSYTGPSWLKLIDVMKELQIDELIPLAEQIHADAQQVAEDKPVIVQAKDDAIAAASAAAASEGNAATSESNAATSAATATTKAQEAADSAAAAGASNPLLALQKSLNLSDLADRAAAWLNVRPIGATPLAAAAVSDGDAPQWRQVQNLVNAGTGGPTMNGVMNYHVGEAVTWETRAYYPPNCLPRDGQLVNRADWPELWAWAQKTSPITDAAWLADVTKRGAYSTGDGSTTFRLPDWNGVQSGSIPANFFRGGVSAADMTIKQNAAPNITGTANIMANGGPTANMWMNIGSVAGALTIAQNNIPGARDGFIRETDVGAGYSGGIGIDASKSSLVYGRNSTTEVYPNHVSGVWLVRASGGFVAANTTWSVINSLTAAPGVSTTTYGGDVNSTLKVGTADYGKAGLRAVVTSDASGVKSVGAQVVVTDSTGSSSTQKIINLGTVNGLTGGEIGSAITVRGAGLQPKLVASHLDYNPALGGNAIWIVGMTGTENILQYVSEVTGQYYSLTTVFRVAGQQQFWSQTSTGRYLTPLGELAVQGSDVRIKNDFTPPKSGAWERVEAIGICEFKYNGSDIPQRGFLAQQMGDIDSMYVFTAGKAEDESGKEFDILNVNDRAVMADMIAVIQTLQKKVTDLEKMLASGS